MSQAFTSSSSYHENAKKCEGDEYPCIICGRPIDPQKAKNMIRVHAGGGLAVTEEEAATMDPAADLGCQPIGSDCLRKHPELKKYVL